MDFFEAYYGCLSAIFFCILFIGLGLPLAHRKIKRNFWYGFRMKYTMKDDEIWYEVNELAGKQMVSQGISIGIIGIFLSFLLQGKNAQLVIFLMTSGILSVGIIYSLVTGFKLMNKMAVKKGLKKSK